MFGPGASDDALSIGLRMLTHQLMKRTPEQDHGCGLLGGAFGYGVRFENDVFVMRPFYWGDCDCGLSERETWWNERNHHDASCYQVALSAAKKAAGLSYIDHAQHTFVDQNEPYDPKAREAIYDRLCKEYGLPDKGAAVHCTCGYEQRWITYISDNGHRSNCSVVLPNFVHRPSGLAVEWYKYIGRDNEVTGGGDVTLEAVFRDCLRSINGPSLDDAIREYADRVQRLR